MPARPPLAVLLLLAVPRLGGAEGPARDFFEESFGPWTTSGHGLTHPGVPGGMPGDNGKRSQCTGGLGNGPVCCPVSCGVCGGTECASRPGGSLDCCGGTIPATCTSAIGLPPCVYRADLSDHELDEITNELCCSDNPPWACFSQGRKLDAVMSLQWCSAVHFAHNVTLSDRSRWPRGMPAPRRAPPSDGMKVDLWVTTKHEYRDLLTHLLDSVKLFWPLERWRSDVVVVLNEDSDGDRELCGRLPAFATCLLQPAPDFAGPDEQGWTWVYGRGMTRAVWVSFMADLHASPDTDWIAILDPDVVFFTPFVPDLLFDWSGPEPRPVVFGAWFSGFSLSAVSLRMNWVAQFMDSFPNMVRPRHLRAFREHLCNLTGARDFTEAYQRAMARVFEDSRTIGWWTAAAPTRDESLCFQAAMYHYLWHHHREDFFWSIRDGAYHEGVGLEHTCPSLRAARHFGGDRSVKTGPKLGSRRGQLEYSERALETMLAGERGLNLASPDPVLLEALTSGDTGPWKYLQPRGVGSWYAMVGRWVGRMEADTYFVMQVKARPAEVVLSIASEPFSLREFAGGGPTSLFTHEAVDGDGVRKVLLRATERGGLYAVLVGDRGRRIFRGYLRRKGDTGAHCGERRLESLLRAYASWDRERAAV